MICKDCGGYVEWKGKLTDLTHTECAGCGAVDNQEPDEPESPLTYYPVGEGYEASTWPGEDAQQRAEASFAGWKLLGRPDCISVRKMNKDANPPTGSGSADGSTEL